MDKITAEAQREGWASGLGLQMPGPISQYLGCILGSSSELGPPANAGLGRQQIPDVCS